MLFPVLKNYVFFDDEDCGHGITFPASLVFSANIVSFSIAVSLNKPDQIIA